MIKKFLSKIYFWFFPRKVVKVEPFLDPADDIKKLRKLKKWHRILRDHFKEMPTKEELTKFCEEKQLKSVTKTVRPDRVVYLHEEDGIVIKMFEVTMVRRELPIIVKSRISPVSIVRKSKKSSEMLGVQYYATEVGEKWACDQIKRELGYIIPRPDVNNNNAGYFDGRAVLIDW